MDPAESAYLFGTGAPGSRRERLEAVLKIYTALPSELVEGWRSRIQTHPAAERIAEHYHDSEEWLEVTRGEMTFASLSGEGWRLRAGDAFHIPRGEVHRVQIGDRGVEYRMYAETEMLSGFSRPLGEDDLALLRTNLEFPIREENADGHAADFFREHLSDALTFVRADTSVVGKEGFTAGFAGRGRASRGSICVLNRSDTAMLITTVVTVGTGPAQKAFTNVRLWAREADAWKCRVWVNYPEPL